MGYLIHVVNEYEITSKHSVKFKKHTEYYIKTFKDSIPFTVSLCLILSVTCQHIGDNITSIDQTQPGV